VVAAAVGAASTPPPTLELYRPTRGRPWQLSSSLLCHAKVKLRDTITSGTCAKSNTKTKVYWKTAKMWTTRKRIPPLSPTISGKPRLAPRPPPLHLFALMVTARMRYPLCARIHQQPPLLLLEILSAPSARKQSVASGRSRH